MNMPLTIGAAAHSGSIRALALGAAFVAASLVAPGAMLADDATFDPPTQNERSIALIEGKDPANSPADTTGDAEFQPPTANERSIALTESKEASGDTAFVPLTSSQRSIMLLESRLAPGGVLAGGVPVTVRSGDR